MRHWIPPVRARLAGRAIFNFRLPPDALASLLPAVPWLSPQVINGFGVASFCVLDLRGITVAPLPTTIGLASVSCAPRLAAIDASTTPPRPAVFVAERWTGNAFGSWFTSLGFSAPHPHARARWTRDGDAETLAIDSPRAGPVVSARFRRADVLRSSLFASSADFAAFIKSGIASYGLSRHAGRLTKLDLHKADQTYEPLSVDAIDGPTIRAWRDAGGELDSAFRTAGGRYEWTYHGLTDAMASA